MNEATDLISLKLLKITNRRRTRKNKDNSELMDFFLKKVFFIKLK